MSAKCLSCYQPLTLGTEGQHHSACLKRIFGLPELPEWSDQQFVAEVQARLLLAKHNGIQGVQPKLSIGLQKSRGQNVRTLFIPGDRYILKIQAVQFAQLPENEDICMHLAAEAGLEVPRHTLLNLPDGTVAYLTVRFDRGPKGEPLHQEDFAQAMGVMTSEKYSASLEKVSRFLLAHSTRPGLDAQLLYKQLLFHFLVGNNDVHLKNLSFVYRKEGTAYACRLSPVYDIVSVPLVLPQDKEESALPLNGKKNRLQLADWLQLAERLQIAPKVEQRIRKDLLNFARTKLPEKVNQSFLHPELQERLVSLVMERSQRLI